MSASSSSSTPAAPEPAQKQISMAELRELMNNLAIEEALSQLANIRVVTNANPDKPAPRLHAAALLGLDRLVRALLDDKDVDPNEADASGQTALFLALMGGQEVTARILLDHPRVQPDLALTIKEIFDAPLNLLQICVARSDLPQLRILLAHPRVDVNATVGNVSVLTVAMFFGSVEALEAVLGHPDLRLSEPGPAVQGGGASGPSDEGMLPLHVAAARASLDKFVCLLKAPGMDVNAKSEKNKVTALQVAVFNRRADVVWALLQDRRADLDARDDLDRTALHSAAEVGDAWMVRTLLTYGAQPNVQDRWGITPLSMAVRKNFPGVVQVLLDTLGLDLILKDKDEHGKVVEAKLKSLRGEPHGLTLEGEELEFFKRLQPYSPDVSVGETAVALAARLGHRYVLDMLSTHPRAKVTQEDLRFAQPAMRKLLEARIS